jgi:arylsulfatase A-like enzyme
MTQPNIVLFYADQHRSDVLGCAGNDVIATPNIDRLAADGVRFSNAWTESPICQPARASFITGRFAHEHGRLGNFTQDFDPGWPTFMRQLQAAGYTTASIGKTHYSGWPLGPDHAIHWTAPPSEEWIRSFGWDYVVEEYDRYVHAGGQDTPYMRFLCEQDALPLYQDAVRAVDRAGSRHWVGVTSPLPQSMDLTSFLADEAVRWLSARDGRAPFFLQLSFVAPHVPLMGDPVWAAYYADADIRRGPAKTPAETTPAWADHLALLRHHSHSDLLTDEFVLAGARQYYAMVSLIDQRIGDIIALLERRGWLDSTWLLYAADHGEMLGDHGLMAKMNFYAPSVRIPAVIRPAGGTAARVVRTPVQGTDLAATIVAAAGATPPPGARGRSLVPAVGGGTAGPGYVFSEIQLAPGLPTFCAVSDAQWRLTLDAGTGAVCELFNLDEDPGENDNLAGLPSYRSIQEHYAEAARVFLTDPGRVSRSAH